MTQQGEPEKGAAGQGGDWWDELYEPGAPDTGASARAEDTLDDRFDSAAHTVGGGSAGGEPVEEPAVDEPADAAPVLTPPTPDTHGTLRLRRVRQPQPPPEEAGDAEGAGEAGDAGGIADAPPPRPAAAHPGDRPPTYHPEPTYPPEPTALPATSPGALADLVPDTVLDGAAYGTMTLRCASVRGDSARYRGEPRRDALLTARFGSGDSALVLVALATGARGSAAAPLAARDACLWLGGAVGRNHARLDQDIREGRRGSLKSGLHRLTGRTYGLMRARAAERGVESAEDGAYQASLRCLLLPADPACRIRVFFGTGPGGLFRLRDGVWQDIEPEPVSGQGGPVAGYGSPQTPPEVPPQAPAPDPRAAIPDPRAAPANPPTLLDVPSEAGAPRQPFAFRASVAAPGDVLLLTAAGLAGPLREAPAFTDELARRWRDGPPGLAAYLVDVQLRVEGHADDRTAAAVWEG
ncbi:hypothetical protein ACFQLX_09725 [Streptomyces polyrhachis]|uniref:PPM-type phosphatase domain-containing protein n=1 Tax=Streptomyces polyrhachis TaxID=1282885 RepID=A0ABW2GGH1_9ACTN